MIRAAGGLFLSVVIAATARRTRSLSGDGAVCAVIVGTLSVAAGWDWGTLLIAFFLTSTLLSRFGGSTGAIVEKGGARDAMQVLANGGLFALAAAAYLVHPASIWQAIGAGALAASTSDTWATEIGTRAKRLPRSIITWRPVPAGMSGGVTLPGTLAAIAGAVFIGIVAALLGWSERVAAAAIVGGIVGSTADSVLGATLQARRRCPACKLVTERSVHNCGARTAHAGGLSWLTNDGVNAVSAAIGAMASIWGGIWTAR